MRTARCHGLFRLRAFPRHMRDGRRSFGAGSPRSSFWTEMNLNPEAPAVSGPGFDERTITPAAAALLCGGIMGTIARTPVRCVLSCSRLRHTAFIATTCATPTRRAAHGEPSVRRLATEASVITGSG